VQSHVPSRSDVVCAVKRNEFGSGGASRRCIAAASCALLRMPNLTSTRFRWLFTVVWETNKRSEISALRRRWPTKCATRRSEAVRLSHPDAALVRVPYGEQLGCKAVRGRRI